MGEVTCNLALTEYKFDLQAHAAKHFLRLTVVLCEYSSIYTHYFLVSL